MSLLKTNVIQTIAGRNILTNDGPVIQCNTKIVANKAIYSSPTSGNGTPLWDLTIGITPTASSSRLIIQWMIMGEIHHNNVFTIWRNGSLVTTAGEQGYNNNVGNSRWSGIASGWYDRNESSTPSAWFLQHHCIANTTSYTYFTPAVRSSSTTAYSFRQNKTIASNGADAQENGLCSVSIFESIRP